MLGLLSIGLPGKAISLALATVVLATSLAVVPVPASIPLIDDSTETASAHTQTSCTWEPTTVTTRTRSGGEWTTSTVTRWRRVCVNVSHLHWWERALVGGSAATLCAGVASPLSPAGMLVAAAACGALTGGVSR